jgi:beta-glucuronidase
MKKNILLSLLILLSFQTKAQGISLNGTWSFAIDPLNKGEISGWSKPWKVVEKDSLYLADAFDKVTVPHCWSLDRRYNHIGKSWYRKGFKLPTDIKDKTVRLHFEAVFYKCRIFLNGVLVAYHSGGYTPFNVDISKQLKYPEVNFLSIEVDNSWDEFAIPGVKIGDNPRHQLFPWYEYGGITRDISLLITSKIYVSNQKIEAVPNLKTNTASIKFATWIENKSLNDTIITLSSIITNRTNGKKVLTLEKQVKLRAFTKEKIFTEAKLTSSDVLLWDFDNPNLYDVQTTVNVGKDILNKYDTYFGIREFRIDKEKVQFLLNGKPIRGMGANRASDHPVYGSTDPEILAKEEMTMLRNGNMFFSRLCHTPASKYYYKWADENGYLITAEIPAWQTSTVLMENQKVRDEFTSQMTEFVETYWNSPSIVAFSVGNEYDSWTPEGDEWTRYHIEKYRQIDSTRLMTFAALNFAANAEAIKVPHDSFRHCDFINFNCYSSGKGLEKSLKSFHEKYPDKPIFASEFGKRSDEVKSEKERIDNLKEFIEVIKNTPYAVGASYWTATDYASRYPNTHENGYRPWGMIDEKRQPRELYKAFQNEASPVIVKVENNKISITAKSDFPSYTIKNHVLKIIEGTEVKGIYSIPEIGIGKTVELKINKTVSQNLVIENQKGFRVYYSNL